MARCPHQFYQTGLVLMTLSAEAAVDPAEKMVVVDVNGVLVYVPKLPHDRSHLLGWAVTQLTARAQWR